MKTLELKIPPALLMLLMAALMWLLDHYTPDFRLVWWWYKWVAWGVFVGGLLLIVSGALSFHKAQTTVDPTHPENATTVVTSGIYRYTRNPMYLGFLMILLAYVFKLSNPINLLILPLFVVYMNRYQIKPEERALTKRFGQEYKDYCDKVRRWF